MLLLQWQSDCMHPSLEEALCWDYGERFNTDLERTSGAVQGHANNLDYEHELGE